MVENGPGLHAVVGACIVLIEIPSNHKATVLRREMTVGNGKKNWVSQKLCMCCR